MNNDLTGTYILDDTEKFKELQQHIMKLYGLLYSNNAAKMRYVVEVKLQFQNKGEWVEVEW